jgi:hypothetical protein
VLGRGAAWPGAILRLIEAIDAWECVLWQRDGLEAVFDQLQSKVDAGGVLIKPGGLAGHSISQGSVSPAFDLQVLLAGLK